MNDVANHPYVEAIGNNEVVKGGKGAIDVFRGRVEQERCIQYTFNRGYMEHLCMAGRLCTDGWTDSH